MESFRILQFMEMDDAAAVLNANSLQNRYLMRMNHVATTLDAKPLRIRDTIRTNDASIHRVKFWQRKNLVEVRKGMLHRGRTTDNHLDASAMLA